MYVPSVSETAHVETVNMKQNRIARPGRAIWSGDSESLVLMGFSELEFGGHMDSGSETFDFQAVQRPE